MKQSRYLNSVLTVIAVLLAALLWAHVSERPILADEASAQVSSRRGTKKDLNDPKFFPNASTQRKVIIDNLDALVVSIHDLQRMLSSGKMQVEVTNLDDLEVIIENNN